ncbi:conjugal transfer protein TraG N-terminal domain-containing protein [Pseudomonas sp. PDM19]|uniref:conjugal transfer protein TraG N-terminal domain-containing protein n=1 Tax=Pseudomonas sp. PDM19 TaxID=2769272 RepID=UPI001786C151|nr:conjugal transfer protein TraG N-terminal domain-containing protein [Pseudomonas sp. PDM19]MBD9634600.1 conjugal transfer protein TraG N-terminal domain-containing protein [Pseudomonas sp. PDM19]
MDFTIYTAGSSEFLQIMLNSCAMLTGSGSIDDMARIGALMGVLVIGFQAGFKNQPIPFHAVGIMLIGYMCFYGPTATVIVQDTTTDQVRVVDNVPLGPAFVGSVFSTVGYRISELAEQANSTPGMTRYGLFSSLTTLARVRDVLRNPVALDQFQNYKKGAGWDLGRSFQEYMTYCNFNPVFLRNKASVDQLQRTGDVASLLSNTSEAQSVYFYDSPSPSLKTCAEAGRLLTAALQDVLPSVFEDIMQKGFSDDVHSGKLVNFTQMQGEIDNSLQSFALSNKKASEYVAASLIQRYFNQGRVDALNHWQERRAAMALQQSLSQQEIQWAGKGDSFKFYIKPMLGFLEGLVYAVAPFMALLLMMGSRGAMTLAKFCALPLSTSLCMPLLSVVNAFTLWYAGAKMEAIFNGYDPISTGFAQMQLLDIDQAIGSALGLGGYLAAYTPAIAASIVGAGAFGMTAIMSGATSDTKFNSEDMTPRTQRPSPVMATEAVYTADQVGKGVSVTGATQLAETISGQQAASAFVQSSKNASVTATENMQRSLQSAIQQSAQTTTGQQNLASLGHQVASSLNLSQNSQFTSAASQLKSLGFNENKIAQGVFAASAGAAAPLGLAGARLEDSEQFQKLSSTQQQQAQQAFTQLTSAVQASSNDQTAFNAADSFSRSSQASVSQSTGETLSQSIGQARQAQETYSRASKMENVYAASQSLNLKQAAVTSLLRGESRAESAQALAEIAGQTEGGRAAFNTAMASASIRGLSTDREERVAMAAIRALNQDGRLGDLVSSKMSPFDFSMAAVSGNESSGLAQTSISTGNLQTRMNQVNAGASEAFRSNQDMSNSGLTDMKESGPLAVQESRRESLERIDEANDMASKRMESLQQDNPVPTNDIDVKSTTPVLDTAKSYADGYFVGGLVKGAEQLSEKGMMLFGADEAGPTIQSMREFANHPIDTMRAGLNSETEADRKTLEPAELGPGKPASEDVPGFRPTASAGSLGSTKTRSASFELETVQKQSAPQKDPPPKIE